VCCYGWYDEPGTSFNGAVQNVEDGVAANWRVIGRGFEIGSRSSLAFMYRSLGFPYSNPAKNITECAIFFCAQHVGNYAESVLTEEVTNLV
jgi:hypothetical protein